MTGVTTVVVKSFKNTHLICSNESKKKYVTIGRRQIQVELFPFFWGGGGGDLEFGDKGYNSNFLVSRVVNAHKTVLGKTLGWQRSSHFIFLCSSIHKWPSDKAHLIACLSKLAHHSSVLWEAIGQLLGFWLSVVRTYSKKTNQQPNKGEKKNCFKQQGSNYVPTVISKAAK